MLDALDGKIVAEDVPPDLRCMNPVAALESTLTALIVQTLRRRSIAN